MSATNGQVKSMVIPKTFGSCADRLYAIMEAKRALAKQVEELEQEESAIKNHLINNISKQDGTGVSGRRAKVKIVTKDIPTIQEEMGGWADFYTFVARKKAFHLLQKRLSTGAVNEMLDDGVKIPGIGIYTAVTVSVTKL